MPKLKSFFLRWLVTCNLPTVLGIVTGYELQAISERVTFYYLRRNMFIWNQSISKVSSLLDGKRELFFTGLTVGQFGIGFIASKARITKHAMGVICKCSIQHIYKELQANKCFQCGKPLSQEQFFVI